MHGSVNPLRARWSLFLLPLKVSQGGRPSTLMGLTQRFGDERNWELGTRRGGCAGSYVSSNAGVRVPDWLCWGTCLAHIQLGDSLGILAASLVSIPLQVSLCHAQVARGRDLCTRV